MKIILITILGVCVMRPVFGGELEDKIAEAAKFGDGNDANALKWIEQQAVASLSDADLRSKLEEQLLAALPTATTRRAKDFLCRMLRIAGTEKSIPVLEKLLADPESSHMARYVLASMRTDPAAKALHRSLKNVPDKIKPGIVDSLGDLRHEPAVPDLVKLLASDHSGDNAARALGLIGGKEAVAALWPRLDATKGESRHVVLNALLRCAESYVKAGNSDAAMPIYDKFADGESETHVILSGLRGIAKLKGEAAVPLLAKAMQGENRELANGAAGLIASIEGKDIGEIARVLRDIGRINPQACQVGNLFDIRSF